MFKTLPRVSFILMGLVALIMMIGCSGGKTTDVSAPSAENIADSQNQIYDGNTNLGEFVLTIDPETHTASIEPSHREGAFDVTPFVRVVVRGFHWDELKRIWTVDIEVVNPSPFTGYGPWVVFTETGRQRILNQDGFIWIGGGPGYPPKRVPVVAFAKDKPQRVFQAQSSEFFQVHIHWPPDVNTFIPMHFYIDASYPGPRQEPIVERLRIEPTPIPEGFELSAFVKDWQPAPPNVEPLEVWVDLTPIGGPEKQHLEIDPSQEDICRTLIMAIPPEHPVPLTVYALDWEGFRHENDVMFGRLGPPPDCLHMELIAKGRMGLFTLKEMIIRDPQNWDYWWKQLYGSHSQPPYVNFDKDQVVWVDLGQRRSTGYFVNIDCVKQVNGPDGLPHTIVDYTEYIPGEGCNVLWVLTSPFQIVKTPKTVANDHFIYHDFVYSCEDPNCFDLRPIASGSFSNIRSKSERYIKSPEEWRDYWTEHNPNAPVPEVDWAREEVVAVTLGQRNTGGFSIKYDCISMQDDDPTVPPYLFVEYTEMIPGEGCMVPDVITYPFNFVAIPRQDASMAKFDHNTHVYTCP